MKSFNIFDEDQTSLHYREIRSFHFKNLYKDET